MTGPVILYCMGAAKAGTSWFYRALHDHPQCRLRAVKEVHYWDTFDAGARERQIAVFATRLAAFEAALAEARAGGIDWQAANMARRVADMTALIAALQADRTGDAAYRDWLTDGAGTARLVADMTPAYALVAPARMARMARLSPLTRFVYLVRDPLTRLWSHIRMQAMRQRQPGEVFEEKANNTLWRILNKGQETHILQRGDYPKTVARLQAAVPEGALRVEYCERLYTPDGYAAMCGWLGLDAHATDGADKAHEGPQAAMRDDLAVQAVGFLKDQYDWAARTLGPLPREWQDNLARANA